MKAFAIIQTKILVLVSASTLIFDFAMVSSVWTWYMQKLAATSKIFDNEAGTVFVSHMFD